MEIILLKQICIMFLLIAVGVYLVKRGFLTEQGSKDLGGILLQAVIPCVVIKSYIVEYTAERAIDLLFSAGLALVALLVAMAASWVVFGVRGRIENFGAAFCNVGFIGIPLVQSVLGESAVFYLASNIALLNILQWTYGVVILSGKTDVIRPKALVTSPVILAFIVGLLIFFLQIPVPEIIVSALSNVTSMNTPLAMIILGTYLAKMKWQEIFTTKKAYLCVAMRLVVIPLLTLLVLCLIPGVNLVIKQVILIAGSTPVGSNLAIFAKQYDADYKLSVAAVCLSTILSIVTVPAFYMVVERVLV